jgi:D-amino-acid dehydrogenase
MKVVVIGAGVFGASAAYHLQQQGADVTVIDRTDLGRATAAGAGIVCPWLGAAPDRSYDAMANASGRYYPELIARLERDGVEEVGYRKVGSLVVPETPEELDAAEARLVARSADAAEMGAIRRLTASQAGALFPVLRQDFPAVHIEGAGRVDGRILAKALLAATDIRGGAVEGGSASEIVTTGGRVSGVRVGARTLGADAAILATGAWASELLEPFGLSINVAPQRGQIIHMRLREHDTDAWPIIHPLNGYYMLAFDSGRIVVGATRETGSGFDYRATAGGVAEVLTFGLAWAPGLVTAEIIETRIGFRPMAIDDRPMLGAVPDVPGLFVGNGLGHSGLTLGTFAGKMLADIALERAPELDPAPYSPFRV